MAYKIVNDDSLTSVANAIRVQGSISGTLEFPDGFVSAIQNLSPSPTLQTKTKTYTPTTSQQAESVVADSGYDGLDEVDVTVNAIPSQYKDTTDATATADKILQGYTAYANGQKLVGTASGGITPSGTYSITSNGIYDIVSFASVDVNVSGGGGDHDVEDGIIDRTISGVYENSRVTRVGSYAFYSCTSLTAVSLPNATSIYNYAFASCSSLTTAIFPNATRIYTSAFTWCHNLLALDFAKVTSVGSYAFAYCSALTTANFPNLSSVGAQCFLACQRLTTASLPKLITIGSSVFSGCSSLMSVYLLSSSVIIGKAGMFTNTPISKSTYTGSFGSIYVPASLVDSYKSAMYWSVYADRITSYTE